MKGHRCNFIRNHHLEFKKFYGIGLRRTVSLTDVRSDKVIMSSGTEVKIEPLYDVPRSTPIYAVVNKAAKIKNRNQSAAIGAKAATESCDLINDKIVDFETHRANISNDANHTAVENDSVGVNGISQQEGAQNGPTFSTSTTTVTTTTTTTTTATGTSVASAKIASPQCEGVNVKESIKRGPGTNAIKLSCRSFLDF